MGGILGNLLPVLLRPIATLLSVVLGWKFLEGEIDRVFSSPDPSKDDMKKQTASVIGMVAGIALGAMIVGLGKGKGRRR